MQFPRIYADEKGETHIGVLDVAEQEARIGPPPNPVGRMTATEAVSTFAVFSAPAGTEVPSHRAPQPYICIVLSGEGEVETSDGKTLIVAETTAHRLTGFDVLADGSLANRRIYAQLPEDVHPDGIALDAEGAVWLADPEGQQGVCCACARAARSLTGSS